MEIGEVYYNKFNRYYGTVVDITDKYVSLETQSGVRDLIRRDRFDLNWVKKDNTMKKYADLVRDYFPNHNVSVSNKSIKVKDLVKFDIDDDFIYVSGNDSIKSIIGDYTTFVLDDIEEVLELVASLID